MRGLDAALLTPQQVVQNQGVCARFPQGSPSLGQHVTTSLCRWIPLPATDTTASGLLKLPARYWQAVRLGEMWSWCCCLTSGARWCRSVTCSLSVIHCLTAGLSLTSFSRSSGTWMAARHSCSDAMLDCPCNATACCSRLLTGKSAAARQAVETKSLRQARACKDIVYKFCTMKP